MRLSYRLSYAKAFQEALSERRATRIQYFQAMNEITDIHKPFLSWLHKNKLLYVYHRPDKRSGIVSGWPDFTIVHCGRCLLIEAKTASGKLSPIQDALHVKLRNQGNTVVIARSVPEAISAVQTWLGVEKPEIQPPERENEHIWVDFELGSICMGCHRSVPKGMNKPEAPCCAPPSMNQTASATLWIASMGGVEFVFSGDSTPGGLATKLRRATPQDMRDLPRK